MGKPNILWTCKWQKSRRVTIGHFFGVSYFSARHMVMSLHVNTLMRKQNWSMKITALFFFICKNLSSNLAFQGHKLERKHYYLRGKIHSKQFSRILTDITLPREIKKWWTRLHSAKPWWISDAIISKLLTLLSSFWQEGLDVQ